MQKNTVTVIPHFIPFISAIEPTNQGPIIPPTPAKKNSIPNTEPLFSLCRSAADAVTVGKIIEKKKPVKGRIMDKDEWLKIPAIKIKTEEMEAILNIFMWPILSTNVLPRRRPPVIKPKYRER